jgi:hypothetical protein
MSGCRAVDLYPGTLLSGGTASYRVPSRRRSLPRAQATRYASAASWVPNLAASSFDPSGCQRQRAHPGASRGKCRPHRTVGIAIVRIRGVPSEVDVEAAPIRSGYLPVIELVDVMPEIPRRQAHQLIKLGIGSAARPQASPLGDRRGPAGLRARRRRPELLRQPGQRSGCVRCLGERPAAALQHVGSGCFRHLAKAASRCPSNSRGQLGSAGAVATTTRSRTVPCISSRFLSATST